MPPGRAAFSTKTHSWTMSSGRSWPLQTLTSPPARFWSTTGKLAEQSREGRHSPFGKTKRSSFKDGFVVDIDKEHLESGPSS